MNQFRVVITDHGFPNLKQEEAVFAQAGLNLTVAQCKTPEQVVAAAQGADALLVQWAPVTSAVIAGLDRCRVIVRYGIGVDNVDLAAARAKGIAVCNVRCPFAEWYLENNAGSADACFAHDDFCHCWFRANCAHRPSHDGRIWRSPHCL